LGWPVEHMTWEPKDNLDDCAEFLENYWENHSSTDNVTKTGARSSPSSDRMRGDRVSVTHSIARILGQLGQDMLCLKSLLAAQPGQPAALDRIASGYAARKRKLLQERQEFSNGDSENLDAYSDGGKERKGGGGGRIIACKPRKRHCRRCRATGHNARTCLNTAIGTDD
jgi:hypothetical protein